MDEIIYIKLKSRIQKKLNERVQVKDVAYLEGQEKIKTAMGDLVLYQVTKADKTHVVIDIMDVLFLLRTRHPDLDVQSLGPVNTIIEVDRGKRPPSLLFVSFVWFLLFVGAGLAIMNFHEDVSMLEVHQKIFTIITGNEVSAPWLLQIPYSFGLGLGMILFFNHLFRKRINEEPSPLEVEMFNYQQDMDRYVIMTEKEKL
ncbi:stage V sporulation protein AA [Bacillus sp. FJAT-44742]|uniref:stage V sporulation protein AA n=1 Tax=Bacillus sp. FJAT-44742 TaxID=2014005 RepID=UPI000C249A19|nr:stage V sporulation protein AA [Bacillus sp. FJAT-44742]